MLFPEGGRYLDDKIHAFFYGFAMIAKETGRPVVPVILLNINKAYPPGSFFVYDYPIHIIIGEPFIMQKDETEDQFVHRVHKWFVEQMSSNGE